MKQVIDFHLALHLATGDHKHKIYADYLKTLARPFDHYAYMNAGRVLGLSDFILSTTYNQMLQDQPLSVKRSWF